MYLNWIYFPNKENIFKDQFIMHIFKLTSSSPRITDKDDLIDCWSCCLIVTQSCKSVWRSRIETERGLATSSFVWFIAYSHNFYWKKKYQLNFFFMKWFTSRADLRSSFLIDEDDDPEDPPVVAEICWSPFAPFFVVGAVCWTTGVDSGFDADRISSADGGNGVI